MQERKKGFTITELLAVIVIIGILATIATASYNGISKSIKEKTYQSKINLIKTKAVEYATDNDIDAETISVAKLINEGYLDIENQTETNEKITNPVGGYLDCYQVNISKNNDDYDVNISDDGTCNLANLDNVASQIKVYAYEGENNTIINYNDLGSNKDVNWTNKDVYLFLDPRSLPDEELSNIKVTWSFNNNKVTKEKKLTNIVSSDESYANIYKVETKLLFNATITVQVELNNNYYTQKVNVKIDKEQPNLTLDTNSSYEKMDEKTQKATKVINFSGSDGSGSGIGISKNDGKVVGYFLTDDANYTPTASDFNISVSDHTTNVYENGTYYGYTIDGVGNISQAASINVTNVTYDLPVCLLPKANTTWTNQDYTYTYGCKNDKGTGCSYEPISKTISTDTDKIDGFTWEATDNVGNTVGCETSELSVKVDKTAPTCNISVIDGTLGRKNWYTSDVTMLLSYDDNLSGVAEYGISTNTNYTFNKETTAVLNYDTPGVTYYGYVKDNAGNVGTCSITVKRLTTAPTCSLSLSGKKGNNNWYLSDVNVSMQTSGYGIEETKIYSPGGAVNNDSYTLTYDAKTTITGSVTNEAGLSGECQAEVKRDVTPPTATMRMQTTHYCTHTVTVQTSDSGCGDNGVRSKTVDCTTWNSKGFDNRANLENYLKSNYSSYQSIKSSTKDEHDDVSYNQAELLCTDNMTTNLTYKIGNRTGSIYDLDTDSKARSSKNYTLTGTCTDEAGNQASASKNYYRYQEEQMCEKTHIEKDCDSTHIEVTNCDDGNNYTTSSGNNCGGADSNGEYGANGDGSYSDCGWSGGGSGSTSECGHVNEVCDSYTERVVSDGYYKCADNKWR